MPRICTKRRCRLLSSLPGMGWLATMYNSRLHRRRPSTSRRTSGCWSTSNVSLADRLLISSSVAPSESTTTFPGCPLPSVSRTMPLTNASITMRIAMTRVNASAVSTVIRQRTMRLRRLYWIGTLPTASMPSRTTTVMTMGASSRGDIGNESVIVPPTLLSRDLREHFRYVHPARIPGRHDAAQERRYTANQWPPPNSVCGNQERREERNRELHSTHDVVQQEEHAPRADEPAARADRSEER